jgi:hypothetical protein
MKTLIAIVSCHTRQDWANLVRKTWVPLVPKDRSDVLFFVGRGESTLPTDTVQLECDDSYQGLPEKVRSIVRWALDNGYDYMLKCDDDVLLKPQDILRSDFDQFDFTGHECAPNNQVPYGFCYWLSRKAMKIMENEPLPSGSNNDEAWVAHTMNRNGILLHHEGKYHLHYGRNLSDNEIGQRSLRKPVLPPTYPARYFAWCMHCKHVSQDRMQQEFKDIFQREVHTQ